MKRISRMGLAALIVVGLAAGLAAQSAKPVLRAMMLNQPEDYNTYPVAKTLEDLTGYKVNYEMLPLDKPEDKLNLIMASGEPYDFITVMYSTLKAQYGEYARRGALNDLGPLIDQYGPLLKAGISAANWELAKVNGKIFAIPSMAIPYAPNAIIIRQDWLDKLKLKAPETLDELVAVLKAFRDKDPNGNAQLNCPMVVAIGDLVSGPANVLTGAFGLTNEWVEKNGRLVNRLADPRFKDYVAFIMNLYKEGLIDKDFAVNKTATVREKFSSGRAGAMIIHWADVPVVVDALMKNQPEAKYGYLKPLKGKDGQSGVSFSAGVAMLTFVPRASKNAIETIKYLNAKLEPKTHLETVLGTEGKHYRVENGAYYPILPIFSDERNRANNYMTGMDERIFPTYWQARVRKDQRLYDAFKFINSHKESFVIDYGPVAPYLPASSKAIPSLNTMVADSLVQMIIAQNADTTLPALVKKWQANGGDTYTKEINDWFVPYKASLKTSK